ncbi:hypothetical protein FHG87_012896 [Trinorchestia longiramus]|nr:hypothetical protein FHG87_012896 [Trinorchestia longiramus]
MSFFMSTNLTTTYVVLVNVLLTLQYSLSTTAASTWQTQHLHVVLDVPPHVVPHNPSGVYVFHHNGLGHHNADAAVMSHFAPAYRLAPYSPHPQPQGYADTKLFARSGVPYPELDAPSAVQYDPTGHGDPAFSYWNT